jgi:hypothetical protein
MIIKFGAGEFYEEMSKSFQFSFSSDSSNDHFTSEHKAAAVLGISA